MDLFDFFRLLLTLIVAIYSTLVTAQSALGWYNWLRQPQPHMATVRRYVAVAALRLRFRDFWLDCVVCLLLCVAFLILWHAHGMVHDIGKTLADAKLNVHPAYRAR